MTDEERRRLGLDALDAAQATYDKLRMANDLLQRGIIAGWLSEQDRITAIALRGEAEAAWAQYTQRWARLFARVEGE